MASRPTYLGVKNGVPEATVAPVIATAAATCKCSVTGSRPSLQSCPKPRRARQCCRLVNWLTPRGVEKLSQPPQRLRAEREWRHRVGFSPPYSSGFTPAVFVGVYTRLGRRRLQPLEFVIVSGRAMRSPDGFHPRPCLRRRASRSLQEPAALASRMPSLRWPRASRLLRSGVD